MIICYFRSLSIDIANACQHTTKRPAPTERGVEAKKMAAQVMPDPYTTYDAFRSEQLIHRYIWFRSQIYVTVSIGSSPTEWRIDVCAGHLRWDAAAAQQCASSDNREHDLSRYSRRSPHCTLFPLFLSILSLSAFTLRFLLSFTSFLL
uniref:Uncharacterized protein n=1 Tax=Heterorhabditis bacteriophora TaxID=37862 RepID=A0A1I7XSR0_HETBA